MISEEQVFFTNLRRLGDKYIYPFHLYLHHPSKKQCFLFLEANCPLTPERRKFLSHFEKNGAKLAIKSDQKLTFERYLKDVHLLPFAASESLWQLDEIISEARAEKRRQDEQSYSLQNEFTLSLLKDDFTKLIRRIQIEILSLKIEHPQLHLTKVLSLCCLDKDKAHARVISLNYLLINNLRNVSEVEKIDSFLASCLSELGELSLSRQLLLVPYRNLSEESKLQYQDHPDETCELLQNQGIEIPFLSKQIIMEHHERWNGSGYPAKKALRNTSQLGLSLALATHLVEFSVGQITQKKYPLREVLEIYKKRDLNAGLDLEFSFPLFQALIKIQEIKAELSA
jgi:response regulator RpfG family c-di-GMP phosphodiesterase